MAEVRNMDGASLSSRQAMELPGDIWPILEDQGINSYLKIASRTGISITNNRDTF